jgi:nondiscriminating aspartyl-tRNA synthetase
MVGVYERVFAIAKWFRAENSHTRRHLTEGHQMEFEMGFIDDYSEVMDVLESSIRFMMEALKTKCGKELEKFGFTLPLFSEKPFPRLKFSEVKEILREKVKENVDEWKDLSTEGEKELCKYCREKYGCEFVFVTNFYKGVFYAYKNEEGVYENFDLLCREAELVSGGRRIENYEKLKAEIVAAGMKTSDFEEYLSIFKYGMPPHGGFGIGLERLTMLTLGLENIREANIFPSDTKRVAGKSIQD